MIFSGSVQQLDQTTRPATLTASSKSREKHLDNIVKKESAKSPTSDTLVLSSRVKPIEEVPGFERSKETGEQADLNEVCTS